MLLGIDRSRDALAIENLKHARTPGVFGTVYPWCRVPAVKAHTIEERDESVVVVFPFFRSLDERHPFQRATFYAAAHRGVHRVLLDQEEQHERRQ